MLAPHHREVAEFRDVRRSPQNLLDAFVLLRRDPMFRNDFRCDLDVRFHLACAV